MIIDLSERTAIVTGSTEGIGYASAFGLEFGDGPPEPQGEPVALEGGLTAAGEGRFQGIAVDVVDHQPGSSTSRGR